MIEMTIRLHEDVLDGRVEILAFDRKVHVVSDGLRATLKMAEIAIEIHKKSQGSSSQVSEDMKLPSKTRAMFKERPHD